MTKILTVDEMLEALTLAGDVGVHDLVREHVALATRIATRLARTLDLDYRAPTFEPGFGGTAAPFYLKRADQPAPPVLTYFDQGEPLSTRADFDRAMRDVARTVMGRYE